jgi:hypothetical protein
MLPYFMITFQKYLHVHYIQEFGHLAIILMITNGGSTNYLPTPYDMHDQAHTRTQGGSSMYSYLFKKA